jgi:hypothetical protein
MVNISFCYHGATFTCMSMLFVLGSLCCKFTWALLIICGSHYIALVFKCNYVITFVMLYNTIHHCLVCLNCL